MHTVVRYLTPLLAALLGILHCSTTGWAISDREEILVGRISHIEGDLMRYVEQTKDWTLTVPDAPFGLEDALYSGNNARAEMILPNETWMRIGEDTQVQMIDLNADATTIDVASGLARFYNRSRDVVIKATTPFGYVVAPAGSAFDLYVGDESLEVIAVRGEVDFVHEASGTRYPVRQGGNSIIADRRTTTSGNGTVDGPWDDWNNQRESLWAQRQRSRTSSANLLPAPIREDAYVLEDTGRWERVYYDGDYRDMWRPTRVDTGWRPYTNGRWVEYYGDNCWIPSEPFGYVTHHYGSWVYVDAFHAWYWMPPVPRRPVYRTTVVISFGWYPGRVGWFHHGRDIGWVPLAPNEDYYGYRHWGHRTKVIRDHAPMINLSRYHYLGHASIIDRDYLYRGDRYPRDIRRDINKTVIINDYKPVTQWNDFRQDKRRFDFGDRHIDRKPHVETVERIRENDRRRKEIDRMDRNRIERDLQQVKVSRDIPTRTDIRAPINTSKIVDAEKRTAPLERSTLPTREFKPKERERAISAESRHGFDANGATERRPEGTDRLNQRPSQEQESKQRLRSPRDRQMEETGNRSFGENNQQERQRGPRDPQELRRSREEQRSGEGPRSSFSREQERGSRESSATSGEEQVRPQRPTKAEGAEAGNDRFGAGRRDRLNRPAGEEQGQPQQGRDGGDRQRFERPDQQNQLQEEQRPQRQLDRRQRDQQEQQQQVEQAEQRRRQADERLQQQREQEQQQEMRQRGQEEGLRRQQEQDRKSQQQLLQQREQQDQQQEIQRRQQRETDDRQQQQRLQQQREQAQEQEVQQRRQQEAQREQQQQMRQQQEQQQQEMQRRQQQEAERNRQMEMRRQQEQQQQEMQRRQQQEAERNRQMEMRRQQEQQQQEMQRRQQQEAERNRQMEMRRQQEQQQQEMQRRQQEAQREQQQELQRQRQEQQRQQQQQQQEAQRKKRPLTPEEQQQLNQSN